MNFPTPDNITDLKKLQPFLRVKMGGWQEGDGYIVTENKLASFFCSSCNVPVERMEELIANGEIIRTPLAIDHKHPERGLKGMLETIRIYDCKNYYLTIRQTSFYEVCLAYRNIEDDKYIGHEIFADEYTALLKALLEKEGV
jgi:hypothetical protein